MNKIFESKTNIATTISSGFCGRNVQYCLNTDGVLTIFGTGDMYSWDRSSLAPWNANRSNIKKITIEEGVTSIGDAAFVACPNLTTVTISNSVTTIGDSAFWSCERLASLAIGNKVATIGEGAFTECNSLTDVAIPNSVTSIGDGAFAWCESLTSVTLGNSVTSIGNSAFQGCDSLTSVTLGDSVTSIGRSAFFATAYYKKSSNWENDVLYIGNHLIAAKTSLSGAYQVKENTKTIAGDAFRKCTSLTSVTIPDSVTTIGDYAFSRCESLTSVTIGDSVTTIGEGAFYYCTNLTSVTIPDSVTSIGEYAFNNCYSLTSIIIPNSVTTIGESAFEYCIRLTTVTIGNSITTIGDQAFYGCERLTSVTIPDSITRIESSAFDWCPSLTDVYYYGTAEQWSAISIGSLNTKLEIATRHYVIKARATRSTCGDNLTWTLDDDGTLTIMGKGDMTSAPWREGDDRDLITSVIIKNGVTSISDWAFLDCSNLISVTIPDSVTSIGLAAFSSCSNLTEITIPNSVINIDKHAFQHCISLTSINVDIGNPNFSSVDGNLFSKDKTQLLHYAIGKPGKHYTIPDGVKTIGINVFTCSDSLTSITIPDSVTTIRDYAFRYCRRLTSVIIPDSVTTIGAYAFDQCDNLTDVYYNGIKEDWTYIKIDSRNLPLEEATKHFSISNKLTGLKQITLKGGSSNHLLQSSSQHARVVRVSKTLYDIALETAIKNGFEKTFEGNCGADFQRNKITLSIEKQEDSSVLIKGRKRPRYFGSRIKSEVELKSFFEDLLGGDLHD